jgi:transcriptional regulator with XRE-family HTH domain
MSMPPTTPDVDRAGLRAWRLEHDLSQRALGELLGVTWLAVQRWEAGKHPIPSYLHLALRALEHELAPTETTPDLNSSWSLG